MKVGSAAPVQILESYSACGHISAVCSGYRARVVVGELAARKPARHPADEILRAMYLDLTERAGARQRQIANVDLRQRQQVGVQAQIDVAPGIVPAELDGVALDHEPPPREACRVGDLHVQDEPAVRHVRQPEVAVHGPHEPSGIELVRRQLAAHPGLSQWPIASTIGLSASPAPVRWYSR